MLKHFFLSVFCSGILYSCNSKKPGVTDIFPLYPYELHQNFIDDKTGKYRSTAIVKYYVIHGNISNASSMQHILTEFATKHVDSNLLNNNTVYDIRFYKKNSKINKNYRETDYDKIDYHAGDYFATYTWMGTLTGSLRFHDREY